MIAVARSAQIKKIISRRRLDHPWLRSEEVPRMALSSSSASWSERAESTDRRDAASRGVRSEAYTREMRASLISDTIQLGMRSA